MKNSKIAFKPLQQGTKQLDLLRKLNIYKYFEYVAGCDTFSFNKPDPRHLTNVVEIIGGDLKRTMMVGDSEVDANSAHNANLPFVLVKDGYTEKSEKEIKHNESITDFIGFEKNSQKFFNRNGQHTYSCESFSISHILQLMHRESNREAKQMNVWIIMKKVMYLDKNFSNQIFKSQFLFTNFNSYFSFYA